MADESMISQIKTYSVPLLLLLLAILFQLFVIPKSFPVSHYEVLGIDRYSSIDKVTEAYEKLSSEWNSSVEDAMTMDFIKIRYAFELLTNPLWKRDYDTFGIEEQLHILERFKGQTGESFSKVEFPLLDPSSSDLAEHALNVMTTEDFHSTIGHTEAWLIQVHSAGSKHCAQFSNSWSRIVSLLDGVGNTGMVELGEVPLATFLAERKPTGKPFFRQASLLDGVANTGMVELGEVPLAMFLAERKPTGKPFFRQGLPSLIAVPPGCRDSNCLVRYQGDLSVDAVTDWFATVILGLPRILYYSKEILGQKFISKSGHHKVKVIFFSKTGERAPPFLRQAAKNYWAYASFAFVLWKEEESSVWWNTFEVESAPAVVFLKDPGVKPVVLHGEFNSSTFSHVMERNKQQDLPQLRSLTSHELGCDSRGYSRSGNETTTWYCVILAGRPSLELNQMRETMRRVQEVLLIKGESTATDIGVVSPPMPASVALKEKRLTFTWLDGEAQKKYCFFYINSESSYETCGPRRDLSDVPQLIIVRYKRNITREKEEVDRKPKTIWDTFQEEDNENLAAQLVAKYNGTADIIEIMKWVSQIIEDGDSRNLPFFRAKTPELIPEDADPIWSRGAQSVLSSSKGLKQRIRNSISSIRDWMGDPRVGPFLLLGACLSFGSIWLHRNQSSKTSPSTGPNTEEESRPNRRTRRRTSNVDRSTSVADFEPKDAYQVLSSGSDSE